MFKAEAHEFSIEPDLSADVPDARQLQSLLFKELQNVPDIVLTTYPLDYGHGRIFPFIRAASPDIREGNTVVMARAGIHANELSGVVTWLTYAREIFDYAHAHGVKLIVYPLGNPSGLALVQGYPDKNPGHRYNILGDRGNQGTGNNDFLRYKVSGKQELVDDLGNKRSYEAWYWASDVPEVRLPLETQRMHERVKADLATGARILGVVDMHQDLITEGVGAGAYYYADRDDRMSYQPAVDRIKKLGIPLLAHVAFDAGFKNDVSISSDETGAIVRFDGSWPDLMSKLGVPYSITPETTGATPLPIAALVNKIWMEQIITLASRES